MWRKVVKVGRIGSYNFTLITQNMKDFEKIQGLKVLYSFDL